MLVYWIKSTGHLKKHLLVIQRKIVFVLPAQVRQLETVGVFQQLRGVS